MWLTCAPYTPYRLSPHACYDQSGKCLTMCFLSVFVFCCVGRISSQRAKRKVWGTLCPSSLFQHCSLKIWCCWTLETSSGHFSGVSWLPRFVQLCDQSGNSTVHCVRRTAFDACVLCVGGSVCAGVCAHTDGGQSREQIQQGWPVCHLCYTEQWLCLRISHRCGRHSHECQCILCIHIPNENCV